MIITRIGMKMTTTFGLEWRAWRAEDKASDMSEEMDAWEMTAHKMVKSKAAFNRLLSPLSTISTGSPTYFFRVSMPVIKCCCSNIVCHVCAENTSRISTARWCTQQP